MEIADRITSRANPRFKALKAELALSAGKRDRTLVLGTKLIEAWFDAVQANPQNSASARFRPRIWLRLEGAESHPLEQQLGVDIMVLGERLMRDLTEAGSAPEHALVMDLGAEPTGPLAARVIGAWGIQDPGNLGAILRCAAAFGFQEVLLGPGCADPFHPKALRGSMGATFLLPLRRVDSLQPDAAHWYALDGAPGALALADADLTEPLRLWVGNEGHGWAGVDLPEGVRRLAIPTLGVESLNAAVAAGIACYEVARRRG